MTIEEIYAIPANCAGWRVLPNGNCVRLGNCVNLGDGVSLGVGVKWERSPLAVQGSRHLATNVAPRIIQIGCQEHSFVHWSEHVEAIARQHGYTKDQQVEYRQIVNFIVANGVPK